MRTVRTRYADWTRRQASTANCGHLAGAGLAALLFFVLGTAWFIERYQKVIMQVLTVAAIAAASAAGLALLAGLALAVRAGLRWRARRQAAARLAAAPLCEDCGARPAQAEVTYADGVRSGTVRTCLDCWQAAGARARRAAGWRDVLATEAASDPGPDIIENGRWPDAPALDDVAVEALGLPPGARLEHRGGRDYGVVLPAAPPAWPDGEPVSFDVPDTPAGAL